MNKRAKKKAEKRIRGDIHKVLDIVLDINGLEERSRELTGTLPTAFFDFSGHISEVGISIYKDGWDEGGNHIKAKNRCWRLENSGEISKLVDWASEIKKELGC